MTDDLTRANRKRRLSPQWLAFPILVAGILLAVQPLLTGHLPWRADGLLHVFRLVELERAARHGILFPRWLPDLGYGFGFPLFNYYAPLSYYPLLVLRALGLPVVTALQAGYALALLALCLGVFLWTRLIYGPIAALAAAFAAAYAPYFLYDALHRGVLAELWGLAFLALALAAMHHHVARRERRSLFLLVMAYTALILTHNILALAGSALLAAYGLYLLVQSRETGSENQSVRWTERVARHPFTALALGLGLAAFFWLPALLERDLVQIEQLYGPADFFYGNNFLSPAALVAVPRPTDPAQVNPPLAFGLGIPQLVLAMLAWLPSHRERFTARQRAQRAALTGMIVVLLLMALPASQPLWDHLPLLYFVQFPWRFLGPASLLLAVLAGAGASRLPGGPWLQLLTSLLVLAGFGLPWLFPGDYAPALSLAPDDVIRFEAETGWLGTTSAGEYLPRQVQTPPAPETLLPLYERSAPDYLIPRLDSASLPDTVALLETSYELTSATLKTEASAPFEARFFWYYFPGWQLTANGNELPVYAAGEHGLLAAHIPAGEQILTLQFGDTPVRRWSSYLSGASLVVLVVALLLAGSRTPIPTGDAPPAITWRSAAVIVLVGLLLAGTKTLVLDRYPNPFVQTSFDGRDLRGIDVPLQISFGDELVLLGYDLETRPVPADGSVEVVLYWRAQRQLDIDYSVAVHLVDDLGRRFGQQDNFHPGGYPTSRWHSGEYARDAHRLSPVAGTPPGAYTLLVSVYEPGSGRRLEVRAEQAPSGTSYQLAEVAIAAPDSYASVASLDIAHKVAWGAGGLSLAGFSHPPKTGAVGLPLALTLYWQAMDTPDADYRAELHLQDDQGRNVATMRWAPGRESYPTSRWAAGTVVRDERALLVPAAYETAPGEPVTSGRYQLQLALLGSNSDVTSTLLDLGTVSIVAPERTYHLPPGSAPIAQVGELAHLVAYDVSGAQLSPGEQLALRLTWLAADTTTTSYTAFVHLVGPDGTIAAQLDQVPGAGTRPTTSWFPEEIIADYYLLQLPVDAAPGTYRLRLGLYDAASGQRLPVSRSGTPDGDALVLPVTLEVATDG
jgi:hypothetical protein